MRKKILLDSNLAVLFFTGIVSKTYISKHKKLSEYDEADFDLLSSLVTASDGLVFSPNVLTETSNLLRYIDNPIRRELTDAFRKIVSKTEETFIQSATAMERAEHERLGLTDSVLLSLALTGATLLTVDLDLYLAAQRCRYESLNFNHFRESTQR